MKKIVFNQHEELLELIKTPVCVHNDALEIVYANKAYIDKSNKPIHRLLKRPYWKCLPKTKSPIPGYENALKAQQIFDDEVSTDTGEIYRFHSYPKVVDGQYQYSVITLYDMTAIRTHSIELQTDLDILNLIVQNTTTPVFLHDHQGNFIRVNTAACDMTGYDERQLFEKTVFDLDQKTKPSRLKLVWRDLKQKQRAITYQTQLENRLNESKHVELTVKSVLFKGRNLLLSTVQDISQNAALEHTQQRKSQAEELLRNAATLLIDNQQMDKHLNAILKQLGKYLDIDRNYIFTYNKHTGLMRMDYEWAVRTVPTFAIELQYIPLKEQFPWHTEQLNNLNTICIDDPDQLPPIAKNLKKEMQRQAIMSLLLTPAAATDTTIIAIGIESVRKQRHWSSFEKWVLKEATKIVAAALRNKLPQKSG